MDLNREWVTGKKILMIKIQINMMDITIRM